MKANLEVQRAMTPFPHTIGLEEPLSVARDMMRSHNIRHLPVQDEGQLMGIVSKRDLDVAMAIDGELLVSDIYTPEPFTVEAETPLDEVLEFMANEAVGCALVTHHGNLVGIFTTVDACRGFCNHIRQESPAQSWR